MRFLSGTTERKIHLLSCNSICYIYTIQDTRNREAHGVCSLFFQTGTDFLIIYQEERCHFKFINFMRGVKIYDKQKD